MKTPRTKPRPSSRREEADAHRGWLAWLQSKLRVGAWSAAAGLGLGLVAFGVWWWRQPLPPHVDWTDHRPLVVIDAGHGGVDGGTQGFGVLEKHVALATAIEASRELRRRGVPTVLTRESDVTLSLDDRIQFANDRHPAALVSVHFNFTTASPSVRGVETFYSDPKDLSATTAVASILGVAVDDAAVAAASTALADAVRSGIVTRADTPDRGTRNRPDLAITRRTRCPAVLVECAYLSHHADAARAATAEWQTDLAQGIADGVIDWLERTKGPE